MKQVTHVAGMLGAWIVVTASLLGGEPSRPATDVPVSKGFYMPDIRHHTYPPASPAVFRRYRKTVRRKDYLAFMRRHPDRWQSFNPNPDHFAKYVKNHGCYAGLFTLVEYLVTGKKEYADALNRALVLLRPGYERLVKRYKWVKFYHAESAMYTWLVHRELKKRGVLTPEADRGFRDGILYMMDHLHVWNNPWTFWRGPMHRGQLDGWLHRLTVRTWPDIPQAKAWGDYAQVVWNDFWPYRDYPTNDSNYSFNILRPHVLGAELLGIKEMFTDPEMKKVWERLLYTVSPDGSVIPYGPNGGWCWTAGHRLWMFEVIARHTRDGRFRWAAGRIFNYLSVLQQENLSHNWGTDREMYYGAALAYLFADERVKPVPPDGTSRVLYRKETLRLRGKKAALRYLKPFPLFDEPDKGHVCCSLIVTHKVLPHKIVFRSGNAPGDLYMLVDVFPRHEPPLNPTAIIGLVQYGCPMAQAVNYVDDENRVQIEDLGRTAPLVRNTDPHLADAYYMTLTVDPFSDHKLATHAVANVTDYKGLPVDLSRELLFVKNRMVLVRDSLRFKESFLARIAPVWNTQNVAPELGANWGNTFLSTPYLGYGRVAYLACPPRELLVYHAPRPDCRLRVAVRTQRQAAQFVPYALRYEFKGIVKAGTGMHFAHLLVPHKPTPTPSDLAARIKTLANTPDLVAFSVEQDKGRVELLMLNTPGHAVSVARVRTDARRVYLDTAGAKVTRVLAVDGTFLTHNGRPVFRQKQRGVFETGRQK